MELQPKAYCFGCGACGAICTRGAISFSADEEGFLYPFIDPVRCVSCGLCQKVCPVGKEHPLAEHYPAAYAAKHRDGTVLCRSSSGGMFTALSDLWALSAGGAVYGAAFDQDFSVCHLRAQDAASRSAMQGSKYPQSRLDPALYRAVEQDLRDLKKVLFSGTPCQVAAMRSYLGCRKVPVENCLFVDLVCHGAASPAVWKAMLQSVSEKYGPLKEVSFRAKDEGVSVHLLKLVTASGDITERAKKEYAFYNIYSSLCMMRPSCYSCPYSSLKRQGDFTIGDYADLKRQHPDFFCEEGVSSLLVNTEKGEKQVAGLQQEAQLLSVPLAEVMQQNLEMPTKCPAQREKFWSCFEREKWAGLQRSYGRLSITRKMIFHIIVPLCRKLGIYNLAVKIYMKKS